MDEVINRAGFEGFPGFNKRPRQDAKAASHHASKCLTRFRVNSVTFYVEFRREQESFKQLNRVWHGHWEGISRKLVAEYVPDLDTRISMPQNALARKKGPTRNPLDGKKKKIPFDWNLLFRNGLFLPPSFFFLVVDFFFGYVGNHKDMSKFKHLSTSAPSWQRRFKNVAAQPLQPFVIWTKLMEDTHILIDDDPVDLSQDVEEHELKDDQLVVTDRGAPMDIDDEPTMVWSALQTTAILSTAPPQQQEVIPSTAPPSSSMRPSVRQSAPPSTPPAQQQEAIPSTAPPSSSLPPETMDLG